MPLKKEKFSRNDQPQLECNFLTGRCLCANANVSEDLVDL